MHELSNHSAFNQIKFGIGLETRLAAKDNVLSSESMELYPNMPLLEHLVSFRVHYLAELQPSRALKWLPMWTTHYPTNHIKSNTMSEHSQMRLGMHQETAMCIYSSMSFILAHVQPESKYIVVKITPLTL